MFLKLVKNECYGLMEILAIEQQNGRVRKGGVSYKEWGIPLLFSVLIVITSYTYSQELCNLLEKLSVLEVGPMLLYAIVVCVLFQMGVFQTASTLFQGKDYELLASLPISTRTIILSKVVYLYLLQLYITALICCPAGYIWWEKTQLGAESLLIMGLSMFIFPLIPLSCTGVVGAIVALLSKKVRNKGAIGMVITLFFCGAVLYLPTLQMTMEEMYDVTQIIKSTIGTVFPWCEYLLDMNQGSVWGLLKFILISLCFLSLFLWFVGVNYEKIHIALDGVLVASNKKKSVKLEKNTPIFLQMLKKEWKMLCSIPVYTLNALVGPMLALGALCYSAFFSPDIVLQFRIQQEYLSFVPLAIASIFSVVPMTACNLSLEGKEHWIYHSLPISSEHILWAKFLFPLAVLLPPCLIVSTGFAWLFRLSLVWWVIYLLYPVVFVVLMHFIGIFYNLRYPNYHWTNPATIVKQSIPVLGCLVCNGIGSGGLWIALTHMEGEQGVARVYFIVIAVLLCGICVSTQILQNKGVMWWKGRIT